MYIYIYGLKQICRWVHPRSQFFRGSQARSPSPEIWCLNLDDETGTTFWVIFDSYGCFQKYWYPKMDGL